MAEKDKPYQVRKPYDFLALGAVGQKGSPIEASPAKQGGIGNVRYIGCLLYTSPSPRDPKTSRMPSSA